MGVAARWPVLSSLCVVVIGALIAPATPVLSAVSAVVRAPESVPAPSEPPAREPGPVVLSQVFSSADVGFAEGGIQPDHVERLDGMDEYVGAKKPIVRVDLTWELLERESCPGVCEDGLEWSTIDEVVNAANRRGIRVLMMLGYAPPWANGGHEYGGGHWMPTSDADWGDIVEAAARHFKGRVQAYEVWNEPNMQGFGNYGNAESAEQRTVDRKKRYWELVKLAYPRIKAHCPQCPVLAGGSAAGEPVFESGDHSSSAWLAYGYQLAGAKDFFDAVAHHPYPPWNVGHGPGFPACERSWWNMFGPPSQRHPGTGRRCGELAAVRDVMVAHGDAEKKIWGTEWGYPTGGEGLQNQPLETITTHMVDGVHMWRELDYTGPLFLYTYQDTFPAGLDCRQPVSAGCNFGVLTQTRGDEVSRRKQPLHDHLSAALRGGGQPTLPFNQSLRRGGELRSSDGRFRLWLRSDGNLVLEKQPTPEAEATQLWSAGNRGTQLINEADGLLVLRDGQERVVWDSKSSQGAGQTATLHVQDDGNVVLRRDDTGDVIWETHTCCH